MATAGKSTRSTQSSRAKLPAPPPLGTAPVLHGDQALLEHWLQHYWAKLQIPTNELSLLAITQDRREFCHWTGKRLNVMALGCYCYLPVSALSPRLRKYTSSDHVSHRHLIFIEPDMHPKSTEITIAHELIHLADRVNGTPRRHHHHGYDSIAADEAAVTGYDLEELRQLMVMESEKIERARSAQRPHRYLYACPQCGKTYPRHRRYTVDVSCSSCDKSYNQRFRLQIVANATEKKND